MKTIIPFLLLFVSFNLLQAQGNLQFNQVKLVSTIQTVPASKVWKVESVSYSGGNSILIGTTSTYGYPIHSFMSFKINGLNNHYPIVLHQTYGGTTSINLVNMPIWLPAGSTLEASTNVNFLSVIEFNIVP
jgi:hypothetical protein